jgi:hypothetical protein
MSLYLCPLFCVKRAGSMPIMSKVEAIRTASAICGRARLAATHHTNPEMSERFCEMRMMWFSAGVIRSSMTVEEGEALAHEASTHK